MRLPGALGLGRLVETLVLRPRLGVLPVDRLAESLDGREHEPVAQVAVVRDGQHVAARLLLGRGHPLPEILGIVAAERFLSGVRLDQARLRAVLAEDDVAVQVVAARVRGPLEADEGREPPRIVELLGRLDGLQPGRAVGLGAGQGKPSGNLDWPKLRMMSIAASAPWPPLICSYQRLPCSVASNVGSPLISIGKKPMPSEWSATTRKSSGRESRTGWPVFEVISSPRAKR